MGPLEILGSSIRSAIYAPPGKMLVVADLSSIESRVLGWLTGCEKINRTFASGRDSYKVFAEDWLKVPYDQVDKETRNLCKPPDLGCGYQLGPKRLVKYAEGMGVAMSLEQAKDAISVWRATRYEVPRYWEYCMRSIYLCLMGETVNDWFYDGDFLISTLPSGRKLYYYKPKWEDAETPWGEIRKTLTYEGQDSYTNQWKRLSTHGGKITEHRVSGIARDVLYHGMRLYDGTIIGHVHDEAIAEENKALAERKLHQLNSALSTTPPWAPGLILESHGYISKRYKKD